MALNGVDPVGNLTQDSCRVAGASAYFENAVAGLYLGRLDHQRDDVRLRDGLTFADRQWAIFVGEFFETGFDENLAWHTPQRLQDVGIPHPASGNLNINHLVPGAREIKHWLYLVIRHGCALHPDEIPRRASPASLPSRLSAATISSSQILVVCSVCGRHQGQLRSSQPRSLASVKLRHDGTRPSKLRSRASIYWRIPVRRGKRLIQKTGGNRNYHAG
ncbi:hypothetical protein ACVWW3_004787 [Bradyrhizobium sp. LM2.9]